MQPVNHKTLLLYRCKCGLGSFHVPLTEVYGKKKTVKCGMCGHKNKLTPITKYRITYRLEGQKEKPKPKNLAKAIDIMVGVGYTRKRILAAVKQIKDRSGRTKESWVREIASHLD